MANTFLRKISNNVNTTPTTIGNYTVGANLGAVVIGMSVSNTSASQIFANVMIYNGSVEYYIVRNAAVPAGGTLVTVGNEQKVILQAGDSVRASASGNVDAIMSIMETSEVGLTVDPAIYAISSNVASANEGNTFIYSIETTNVPNGTVLYWTDAGNVNSSDFSDNIGSGNITISNGSATFTRTLSEDMSTEGIEYSNVLLRTGSISGPIVAYASNVIVNDTSLSLPGGTTGLKDLVSGQTITAASLPSGFSISNTQTKNGVSHSLLVTRSSLGASFPTFTGSWGTWPATIECWTYGTFGDATTNSPFGFRNSSTNQETSIYIRGTGTNYLWQNNTSGASDFEVAFDTGANHSSWIHWALVFTSSVGSTTEANNIKLFRNGVSQLEYGLDISNPALAAFRPQGYNSIQIGKATSPNKTWDGYISEIRISSGIRYTTDFTPPSTAFEVDGTTISLIRTYQ